MADNNLPKTRTDSLARPVSFISGVYGWMAIGLAITGVTALFTASSPGLLQVLFGNPYMIWVLLIAQVGLVSVIGARALGANIPTVAGLYTLYAILNGLTLSIIFLVYTSGSIASTFFTSAAMFGVMSVYGMVTRRDLSSLGGILMMGVIGIIIASVVNYFLHAEALYWIITYAGVVIFAALTAYDTQKIKNIQEEAILSGAHDQSLAIRCAVVLYLDFINLFLFLLRILGRRK